MQSCPVGDLKGDTMPHVSKMTNMHPTCYPAIPSLHPLAAESVQGQSACLFKYVWSDLPDSLILYPAEVCAG